MTKHADYTVNEHLAVLSARELVNGQIVFAGIGIPLLAAGLAQRTKCPNLTILFEGGAVGAQLRPGKLPPSTNDQRSAKNSNMVMGSSEVLLLLQRGYVDVGFIGGAQIDRFGNLNSSAILSNDGASNLRLPGSGGGNDIASLTNLIVATKHERRRFVERVDFVTSPGWLGGGSARRDAGLYSGGTLRVVTNLAVLGFDEHTRTMKVLALNPGVTPAEVQENTGFGLEFASNLPFTEAPSSNELVILRELDPQRLLTA